jgi:glycosyltransferase involved in cell wall biosynthesis
VAKGAEQQGWNDIYILGRKKEIRDNDIPERAYSGASNPERKIPVIWEGSQFVHHSLALVNREICLQLIDRGCDLSITPYEKHQFGPEADPRFPELARRFNRNISFNGSGGVHVRHQWPPNFTPPPSGQWVMIQPWEFGRLPKEWIAPMSELVDEIWVPSRYVLRSYVTSGIPVERVRVIPNGVNAEMFHPGVEPYPLPTRKRTKFLFVGGTIWRKGIDLLLEAYRRTFTSKDDVSLIIKDIGRDSFYRGQGAQETIRRLQNDPEAPEIVYFTEMLSERDMPRLFTACDCLVHPLPG